MTEPKFGYEKGEGLYDSYDGKWVVIYPTGVNSTFSGRFRGVKEGYAILNPFQGGEMKEGKLVRKLISNDGHSLAPLMGSAIEPVTEKYIIEYCKMLNKKDKENKKSKK